MPWRRNLRENICRGVFYTLCCPCILCVCLARLTCCPGTLRDPGDQVERELEQSQKRVERGRDVRRVRPLGPGRKRELSVAVSSSVDVQEQSPLLSRLPAEIRLQIWEYVLGGEWYHLMQVPKKLGHYRCENQKETDPGRACCLPAMAYWRHEIGTASYSEYQGRFPGASIPSAPSIEYIASWATRIKHPLALLRTCQKVYREVVDIPYQSNDFDIDDPEILMALRQTIPRQRLGAMRSLRIYFESQYAPYTGLQPAPWYNKLDPLWTLMWHTIAFDMPGLRELEVVIQTGTIFPEWPRKDAAWSTPLKVVRGLRRFKMSFIEGQRDLSEDPDNEIGAMIAELKESMCRPREPTERELAEREQTERGPGVETVTGEANDGRTDAPEQSPAQEAAGPSEGS